jgi:peptidoglycan-N-acetylglucosamine deacetylase
MRGKVLKNLKIFAHLIISIFAFFILLRYVSPIGIYSFNATDFHEEEPYIDTISTAKTKYVYLTFDDGPSNTTIKVLDILKKHNVKATFFVVGDKIYNREGIIRRISKEGHSIGLHSYTHDYESIYANANILINEMKKTSDTIYKITGKRPSIIRFPGGTYNQVDKNFIKKVNSKGYKIYDWNVDSEDGISPNYPPSKIYSNSIRNSQNKSRVILLMHCNFNNSSTVKALPQIIKYYKMQGYSFKIITENTPEFHFVR